MQIEIKDTVKINHTGEEYDGEICTVTRVDNGTSFPYQVEMQDGLLYWMAAQGVSLVSKAHPATQKQLNYLSDLGVNVTSPISISNASQMIDQEIPSCHYCGMPATGFGFFDEPACKECGG